MTTKTIMMAVAAAMGLAASASVIEVKFTVKTDVNNKVASKVISGLYDSASGQHVFWTRENGANVPVQNAYFGLVNDTTVAKKIGQNAELIWGDNDENVLVAGAWGSSKSKSGQVAGTFNGKPATGTWSAKVNTKKTYDELLKKNKVTQTVNKEQGVIAAAKAEVKAAEEKAAAEIADAKAEAEASVKAAEEKAAAEIAAAKTEGDAAVKAAEEKAAAEIAAAKTEGDAAVKAAEEKAAAEIAAAKGEFDKELADKQAALEQAQNEMAEIAKAFGEIDDPDMPKMFSDYLAEVENEAGLLQTVAQGKIDAAEMAFANYTNALDVVTLQNAVEDAKKVREAAQVALDAANDTVAALATTNNMIAVIDSEGLDDLFTMRKQDKQAEIEAKQGELDAAKAGFVVYTNQLATVTIPAGEEALTEREQELQSAKEALDESKGALDAAQLALDKFEAPTYENGRLLNFDEFIAKEESEGTRFSDEIEKQDAYAAYKAEEAEKAKRLLVEARDAAQSDYDTKKATADEAETRYEAAQNSLSAARTELEKAIATGTSTSIEELEAALQTLNDELKALDVEFATWKGFKYSDDDRAKYKADEVSARDAADERQTDLDAAEQALLDAESALADLSTTQAERLAELEAEIGKSLTDAEGNALSVAEIRAKVDAYETEKRVGAAGEELASYADLVKAAEDTLAAIKGIREKLGL